MALNFYVITIPAVVILILMTSPSPCGAWKKDIKVRYYSWAVLRCHQNLTVIPDTSQVFWITPDATVLAETTPNKDFPKNVQKVSDQLITILNVTEVMDDQFGYYTCVMVKTNREVLLSRWGLNVDGADFSHLEEEYRKNAVVGAIAAAVMIVLLGGACLLWHFRYSKRSRYESGSMEDDVRKPASSTNVFHNQGYDEPIPPRGTGGQEEEVGSARGKDDNDGGPAGETESTPVNGVSAKL